MNAFKEFREFFWKKSLLGLIKSKRTSKSMLQHNLIRVKIQKKNIRFINILLRVQKFHVFNKI